MRGLLPLIKVVPSIVFFAGAAMLLSRCSPFPPNSSPSEVILFGSIGKFPFEDSIYTIQPDGSTFRPLLSAKRDRSYQSATGNSLADDLIVTVSERGPFGNVETRLSVYNSQTRQFRDLSIGDGSAANAVISPDSSWAAFAFMPRAEPKSNVILPRLWVANLASGEAKPLAKNDENQTWDSSPTWRSDSQGVAFIRYWRTTEGVMSKVMSVSLNDDRPTVVLNEPAADVCYAPDGSRIAIVGTNGLEIFEVSDSKRQLIVPWSKLPGREYRSGGLGWSRRQQLIVFSVLNKGTGKYELWTVSLDRNIEQQIYEHGSERITSLSFIDTN